MEAHGRTPTTRRALLRSGAYLATAATGLAVTGFATAATAATARADDRRGRRAAAYPPTHWIPASTSNYRVSSRPTSYPIDFIVIHVTQETFPDAMKIFQDPAKQVSAHYMVASADGYIGQFVREKDVAWHAGNKDYNNRSIGIEHEGWVDQPKWFTDEMYASSAALTAAICDRYGIPKTRDHIIGHVEVPGADHTDPGPLWDWDRYMSLVNGA
ncbi:peptidoglycan recognition family protein [Streptomyces luomodiensis]|uniref:N-acetylmuramoyl-L-alanine amidase n=1 Tax=Streptomyces luomodiensis TaxID=3026192 RepID=A0ABY9VAM2_9ACTN|nr:peptidoglycan recognition family protein [Streptomyces sp. SCA4-21]WNE99009.1 peptidoglycan recognition family protein [Streptomyces sp. SCA4-21]